MIGVIIRLSPGYSKRGIADALMIKSKIRGGMVLVDMIIR